MQRAESDDSIRRPLQSSKSFSRLESTQDTLTRSRANTLGGSIPEILTQNIVGSSEIEEEAAKHDAFATKEDDEPNTTEEDGETVPSSAPTFEELPIEIRTMTDRFINSLSAKVHPTPLSIETLAEMYQEFYKRASAQIGTHIDALASRIGRPRLAATPVKNGSRPSSIRTPSGGSDQQLLTASELADRRKARRQLELKRTAFEEAVERKVCEDIYEKLWRHRSTDDEERDQKLRSRVAALSLVGIGLRELLVTSDDVTEDLRETTAQNEEMIRDWLTQARDSVAQMDSEKYPVGKLQQLTAAHKSIVETLSRLFPSSSSADEILPTLIYTLITSPPDKINVISNLCFIQRFRCGDRMDGEAAYCLVNLEAAISFLETVDLSSLRAGEPPGGPGKSSSTATTPSSETAPMDLGLAQEPNPTGASPTMTKLHDSSSTPSTTRPQRRLSNLLQTHTNKFEAASDAVRESIKTSADQALDTISSTLDESFKFFFGRLKEQQDNKSPGAGDTVIPKTLEDARKLVSTPPPEDDNISVGASSSIAEEGKAEEPLSRLDSKLSDIFGGKRPIRERSVDSARSGSSGKRVGFADKSLTGPAAGIQPPPIPPSVAAGSAAVESMRNLGTTLNPLSRFGLPRFGRSPASTGPSTPAATSTPATASEKGLAAKLETPIDSSDKSGKALAVLQELKKTSPPLKKFLGDRDSRTIQIGEVEELLKDYKRLATALGKAVQAEL